MSNVRAYAPPVINGDTLSVAGSAIKMPTLRSGKRLPGAADNWDEPQIVNGYTSIVDPGLTGSSPEPGLRSCMYVDTGTPNVSIEGTWNGVHDLVCFPATNFVPDQDEFCLTFYPEVGLGIYVLWNLGRRRDIDISVVKAVAGLSHTPGTPMTVRMDVMDSVVSCYADDVLILTATVPAPLRDSTIHGVSMDMKRGFSGALEAMALSSYTITPL